MYSVTKAVPWLAIDLSTGMQARPEAAHRHQTYFGTTTRRLLQGPPGTVPEETVVSTEADAAMAPMSAMGEPPTQISLSWEEDGSRHGSAYPQQMLA